MRITRPSKRRLAAYASFASGDLSTMPAYKPARPRGKQKESLVNDAVKEWANYRQGILYRNRRGMFRLPSGDMLPYGLGPNGFGDLVGYLTITITPEMIGRKVAVFSMIESKTDTGKLEQHQEDRIIEVRDAGGISGCARSAEDAEAIYLAWREKV